MIGKYIGKAVEAVVTSIVFAFIVGFLLLNAEETSQIRTSSLALLSRAGAVGFAGYDPQIHWKDENYAAIGVEMDSILYDLEGRLPDPIWTCIADFVSTAKEARYQTSRDPKLSKRAFQKERMAIKQALDEWRTAQVYRFGFWRETRDKEC